MRNRIEFFRTLCPLLVGVATMWASTARAEVLDISARTYSRIAQYVGGSPGPTALDEKTFPPGTSPLVSDTRVDRTDSSNNILASAQCVAVFRDQRVTRAFPPTDFGVDIGAFTSDERTRYEIDGNASQTRRIRFTAAETGLINGSPLTAQSLFGVAGAFIVVGTGDVSDLTGLRIEFLFSVNQTRSVQGEATRLSGRATLEGGPGRALTLTGAGAIDAARFPVIDLLPVLPELSDRGVAFAKAVVFPAVLLEYTYEANVAEEFELTAVFGARTNLPAADIGAAAIFGLPQLSLGNATARVRQDDLGAKLAQAVSSLVDTTGSDLPPGGTTLYPKPAICGVLGVEWPLFGLAVGGAGLWRRRVRLPRRRAR